MAEAIARYDAADVIEPSSAGLSPMGSIPEQTKQTLMLNGYSANGLTSVALTREAADAADIVINMTGTPLEATLWDQEKVEDWMVQDPFGAAPETYQRVFEGIKRRVNQLALGLREKREHKTTAK
jgi:protein-tyrosine-phosphatase